MFREIWEDSNKDGIDGVAYGAIQAYIIVKHRKRKRVIIEQCQILTITIIQDEIVWIVNQQNEEDSNSTVIEKHK